MPRSQQMVEVEPTEEFEADQMIASALVHHRRNELDRAETLYREILRRDSGHADALHLLGVLAQQTGNAAASADLISRAIALRPEVAQYYSDLGNAKITAGDAKGALEAYEQGLVLDPENAVAWSNLGSLHKSQGALDDAELALRRAVALKPDLGEARSNLGGILVEKGSVDDAVAHCQQAVLLAPESASAHANLAAALRDDGDLDRAVAAAKRAVVLDPAFAQAHTILAAIFLDLGRAGEAEAACRHALSLNPHHVEALYNLANALYYLGNESGAADLFRQVLNHRPDFADAHLGLGRIHLKQRDLSGFWSVYARRWESRSYTSFRRNFPQPRWAGEDLAGKSILVWGEQGIGDELFFAGLIPEVITAASRTLIETEPRLVPLLRRSFPDATVFERADPAKELALNENINYQAPMGDIGRWLRPSFSNFRPLGTYLSADPDLIADRRAAYSTLGEGPLVGIAWASRAPKHIDLNRWGAILNCQPAQFVSLQYGDRTQELSAVGESIGVSIHQDPTVNPLSDMDRFAAQVAAMDIVITIDNSTLAVSVGLGIPTVSMIPRSADWRYVGEENTCPWHECLTLLRQNSDGEWDSVIDQAAGTLRRFLAQYEAG